jgi:hypothetical protein
VQIQPAVTNPSRLLYSSAYALSTTATLFDLTLLFHILEWGAANGTLEGLEGDAFGECIRAGQRNPDAGQ